MAYIGKSPSTRFSAAAKVDTFTGDGSTVAFDVANIIPAGGENALQVFVNNIRQKPGASNAFTVGNDGSGDLKRITFTAAPAALDEIYVITPYEATNIKSVGDGAITADKIATGAVTTTGILDGTIANGDVSPSAAIADSKLATISTASKIATSAIAQPGSSSVYLAGNGTWGAIDTSQQDTNAFNVSLLGFKMAVNEGLTVFNLVDGVVDEFHDESGADEAEGSNDTYNAGCDYYINSTTPTGTPLTYSAGWSATAITEPDTSTAGTNPAVGAGTSGSYTVPTGVTSVEFTIFGSGGGVHSESDGTSCAGGGGGLTTGDLAVTPGQTIYVIAGEGGQGGPGSPPAASGGFGGDHPDSSPLAAGSRRGGGNGGGNNAAGGGGLSSVSTALLASSTPAIVAIAGSGGGGARPGGYDGGGGGGTQGYSGTGQEAQTSADDMSGGGGSQTAGGSAGPGPQGTGAAGGFLYGGTGNGGGGGGAGYYGGGGGGDHSASPEGGGAGGGGSSYHGHPQVTNGSTTAAGPAPEASGCRSEGGGVANPLYVACTSEGAPGAVGSADGENGYVFLVGSGGSAAATSTTVISNAFTATSVPATARMVVFEENVDTPTLNTDIIASVSRDGGSTFTTATLTDSGYVTGSSGQRILTGQATISGQPSGQSMRWKLALANNQVKVHGVSLQWA